MERLFVYGTLAPGRENFKRVEHIKGQWCRASIKGKLVKQGWGAAMGYPAVIPADDGDLVHGFLLSSKELSTNWVMLDAFEGDGYKREKIMVTLDNGERLNAFVYSLSQSH